MSERQGLPSASGIERLSLCPGSFKLEQQCADNPTPDSDRGTRIAAWLASDRKAPLENPEEQEAADGIAAVEEWAISIWLHSIGAKEYKFVREERLWLLDGKGDPVCSGQADVYLVAGDRGLVLDHKAGWQNTSESTVNRQLRTNAVILSDKERLRAVTVAIIQPFHTNKPQFTYYEGDTLGRARLELLADIHYATKQEAPLVAGDKQCQFCRAALICPARREQLNQLAVTTIHETGLTVSNQELAALRDKCGPAKKLIAAIEKECFERAQQDPESWRELGFEITTSKGRNEITDLPAVTEKLASYGVPWADISARCKMSKGAVKDLLRPFVKILPMTLKDAEWSVLKDNTATKEGKPRLQRIGAQDEDEDP